MARYIERHLKKASILLSVYSRVLLDKRNTQIKQISQKRLEIMSLRLKNSLTYDWHYKIQFLQNL